MATPRTNSKDPESQENSERPAPFSPQETQRLRETAVLFSRLLLHELDSRLILELERIGAKGLLAEMGLDLPLADDSNAINELAVQYFEVFVNPSMVGPPIQSLAEEGKYLGQAAKGIEEIAKAAALSFDPDTVRGAPVDHLGSELFMWSELATRDSIAAQEFAHRHLTWAHAHLKPQQGSKFYSTLAKLVREFIALVAA